MAGSLRWQSCLNRGEERGGICRGQIMRLDELPRSAGVRSNVNYGEKQQMEEEKMSVFGDIVSAIFGSKHAAGVTTAAAGPSAPSPSAGSAASTAAPPPGMGPAASGAKPISKADVEAILAKIADEQDEDLDWKSSIVDLLKLLKLDSGLGARKQLAQELGYTGALDGSAEMSVWLQKQVMTKLAESGG